MMGPRPSRTMVLIASLIVTAAAGATDDRGDATVHERVDRPPQPVTDKTVAEAIQRSPSDYVAAVVEVVSRCEIQHEDTCFDRVRIINLIAQAPPPGPQRGPGTDFFLLSGRGESMALTAPAPRYVVFAIPKPGASEHALYGAKLMDLSADEQSIESLRLAVERALGP